MKTTLNIDDSVMIRLRREAARTGRTMSDLVETALRARLKTRPESAVFSALPTFDSGGALVDNLHTRHGFSPVSVPGSV